MLKKSMFVLLAFLLVSGVFVPAALAEEPIKITVLNYFDLTSPGAEREINEVWYEFSVRNPHIIVEREDLFLEAFHQKTEAYAAADRLPDVIYMWPGGRSTSLHTLGLVKDLRPLLGDDAKYYQEAVLAPQAAGYLAELPQTMTSSHALYVNLALLDSLGLSMPETYEDLVAIVPVLKENGLDTILMGAQDDWVIQSCLFSMIVGRLVGDEKLNQILAGEAKFTDPEFVGALEFYAQMYEDGVLHRKIMNTNYAEVNGLFATGRAPFMIDGDWKVSNFLTDPTTGEALIPVERQDEFMMTIFPAIPGEITKASSSGVVGVGFGMNAKIEAGSAKEAAAWELIKWLQGPEVQKLRLETAGTIPSRVDVTSDQLEPLVIERIRYYEDILTTTEVLDNIFEGDVYTPINIGLQEIGLGFATPMEVAERTQEAFDAWFARQ
ncbi:MAG: extracellular solute-binding protein [Bacillota bacterium]|jgi:raffinose/stachyose/melibiose transport system substrate-binding protein|nr:extracellular solute-binding protein [Bacillota bacterium]HHT91302.1 extracellular solute-binding protein [Bacillota bacterium]